SQLYPASQPGGRPAELRRQFHFLSQTVHRLNFLPMRPNDELAKASLPQGATFRVLANPQKDYLLYLRTGVGSSKDGPAPKTQCENGELSFELALPSGKFAAQWLDPKAGCALELSHFNLTSGAHSFVVPAFVDDIALVV